MKVIFFDTSDTLYHNSIFKEAQENQIFNQLSEVKDISFEDAVKLFNDTKMKLKESSEHVTKLSVMMELGISRNEMHDYLVKLDAHDYLKPDPKLNNLLKKINNSYLMGIITNVNNIFLQNILDALAVDPNIFKHIVSVDNTSHSKPHDEPFQKAIELSGQQAKNCIYLGDSFTKDIIPARRNGMNTIWVNYDSEKEHINEVRIDKIYDLESGLKKLNY